MTDGRMKNKEMAV